MGGYREHPFGGGRFLLLGWGRVGRPYIAMNLGMNNDVGHTQKLIAELKQYSSTTWSVVHPHVVSNTSPPVNPCSCLEYFWDENSLAISHTLVMVPVWDFGWMFI